MYMRYDRDNTLLLLHVQPAKHTKRVHNFFAYTKGLKVFQCRPLTNLAAVHEHARSQYTLVFGEHLYKPVALPPRAAKPLTRCLFADELVKLCAVTARALRNEPSVVAMALALDSFLLQQTSMPHIYCSEVLQQLEDAALHSALPVISFQSTAEALEAAAAAIPAPAQTAV